MRARRSLTTSRRSPSIPQIIEMGGIKWRDLGTEKSGGTKLWSISGHVKKPGVYELPDGLRRHGKVHHGRLRRDAS